MLAEYEAWLPAKIFDAHAHLWNFEYWSDQTSWVVLSSRRPTLCFIWV